MQTLKRLTPFIKGHEWLAEPKHLDFEPRPAEASSACDFT